MDEYTAVPDINQLSFEVAMQELEKIVRLLEEGRIPLQEAVAFYERGSLLKSRCETLLQQARLKIEEIVQNEQGEISSKPSSLEQFHTVSSDERTN